MPAKSARQFRLMQAVAHGNAKGIGGLTKNMAKEFVKKTSKRKRSLFSRGK